MTDRFGNLVQHYEYSAFGQTGYVNNTSAYPVSNRYTGQVSDDETGLYYYGARYYDPQLGRFIQPDTEVQSPDDSQSLNRYSYCANNPINCVDPSGHFFLLIAIIGAIIGALIGGTVAAVTHQNVLLGVLSGAVSGFFIGAGISIGGTSLANAIGCCARVGAAIGSALGGAAGGAASSAIQGGNPGMGALIGGASGAIFGFLDGNQASSDFYLSHGASSASVPGTTSQISGDTTTIMDTIRGIGQAANAAAAHIVQASEAVGEYIENGVPDVFTAAQASALASGTTALSIGLAGAEGALQGLAASFDGAIAFTGWAPFHNLYDDNPEAAGFSEAVGGFGLQTLATAGVGEILQAYKIPSTLYHFTSTETATEIRAQGLIRVGTQRIGVFGRGVYASRWDSPIAAKLMGARSVETSISFSTRGLSVSRTLIPGAFRVRGNVPIP
jgi:RHS repeat-associated protein